MYYAPIYMSLTNLNLAVSQKSSTRYTEICIWMHDQIEHVRFSKARRKNFLENYDKNDYIKIDVKKLFFFKSKQKLFRTMWSRDRDVVLVGHTIDLGRPRGSGNWSVEGMGRGRSVYDQPGTRVDGIAPHKRRDSKLVRGIQGKEGISKGNWQRGTSKGNNEGLRHSLVLLIYICVSGWLCECN
jgi:hypothetical protein